MANAGWSATSTWSATRVASFASAAIPLLRQLWSGEPASYGGKYFGTFADVTMQPPARQDGGPPIWCGGRADAALARTGRLADGYISYVVTPNTYRAALEKGGAYAYA